MKYYVAICEEDNNVCGYFANKAAAEKYVTEIVEWWVTGKKQTYRVEERETLES